MGNEKLNEGTKQFLRDVFGYNDEQIKIIESNPKWLKGIKAGPIMMSKKMVATCVKAQNCSMNVVGDRYVFTAHGTLLKDETCKRPCLWAMAQFLPFSYMLYDRVISGLDPNDMCTDHVPCPDVGCEYGGVGTAIFKITVEDMPIP